MLFNFNPLFCIVVNGGDLNERGMDNHRFDLRHGKG